LVARAAVGVAAAPWWRGRARIVVGDAADDDLQVAGGGTATALPQFRLSVIIV
jgi:hypothetical protein